MNSGSCMTSWPIKVHFRLGHLCCMNRVAHYSGTVAIRRTEKDGGCTFYHNSFRTEHGQLHIKSYFLAGEAGRGGGGSEIIVPVFTLRILGLKFIKFFCAFL